MRLRSSRGFSLTEGLFALFIVSLVLGGMVHTLNSAAQVRKNTKNLDNAIEDFHTMLAIQSDVNAAILLTEPSASSSSDRIILRRVDPRQSYTDRTNVLGDALNPYENSEVVEIEYRVVDDYLTRFRRESDGTERIARLMLVESFDVSLSSGTPAILSIEFSVSRTRVVKRRSMDISVRSLP